MASATNQIVLDVVVKTGKATADVKKFGTETKRQVQQIGTTAVPNLKKVEMQTRSMGQSMAGAGAAISSANGALQLMGRQGPPALQTIASGAASVAVSGFGPLSLASTAATVALSVFLSDTDEGTPKVTAMTLALERQEEVLGRLGTAADSAALGLRAATSGRTAEDQRREEQLRQARHSLRQIEENISRGTARRDLLLSGESGLAPGIALLEIERIEPGLKRLNADRLKELEIVRRISDIRTDTLKTETKIAENSRKSTGLSLASAAGFARRHGTSTFAGPRSTSESLEFFGDPLSEADAIRRVREANNIPTAAERRRQESLLNLPSMTNRMTSQQLLGQTGMHEAAAGRSQQSLELERDSQNRASSFAATASNELSLALQTQDWSGAASGFADAASTALIDAIAAGFIEASGIKKAAAGAFESLGGAFTGGE